MLEILIRKYTLVKAHVIDFLDSIQYHGEIT